MVCGVVAEGGATPGCCDGKPGPPGVPVLDPGVAMTGGVTALGGDVGVVAPARDGLGEPRPEVVPEVPLFGVVGLGGVYFGVVTQGVALGAVAVAGLVSRSAGGGRCGRRRSRTDSRSGVRRAGHRT